MGAGAVLMKQAEDDKVETAVGGGGGSWNMTLMCSHVFFGGGGFLTKGLPFKEVQGLNLKMLFGIFESADSI